ncbi:MAG: class I SAM-dependent methyltransferase [Sandaracinaceae bacterium]|nr:class I SAM-dependent methyltransferase [Sandaracinaceae bacterium]
MANLDPKTVASFGDEWSRFQQEALPTEEHQRLFDAYFSVFPWANVPEGACGADIGCGTGRWARLAAARVGHLTCVDASPEALGVAKAHLADVDNCSFALASVDELPFEPGSLDFLYSLGVLHHVPSTPDAIKACAQALKPGAPMLLYLYYRFDNRPKWFALTWRASELLRARISRLPGSAKAAVCDVLAAGIYWPLARGAAAAERLGADVHHVPLSAYRHLSFYTMRTDARDRFGTPLEQRFTRDEIRAMMEDAGLERVAFSEGEPYWCAVGFRRAP